MRGRTRRNLSGSLGPSESAHPQPVSEVEPAGNCPLLLPGEGVAGAVLGLHACPPRCPLASWG